MTFKEESNKLLEDTLKDIADATTPIILNYAANMMKLIYGRVLELKMIKELQEDKCYCKDCKYKRDAEC